MNGMLIRHPSHSPQMRPTVDFRPTRAPSAQDALQELLRGSIIAGEEWRGLDPADRDDLTRCPDLAGLLGSLVGHGLLTEYQASRVASGNTAGLVLGHYRVLDRLGAGGMGVVYRVEHLRLRRPAAVKVLTPGRVVSDRDRLRFEAEVRAVARLDHPHIVAAIDAGEVDDPGATGSPYFVMEYVPGEDLEECVREHGPLSPGRACGLMHQVASALDAAHAQGLVHRDIKPSNIRVTPDGRAKLMDFGLARQFGSSLTEPGTILGTVDFMAPEQARDGSSVDIRADLFGLGGTLYWCLTGRPPFPSRGRLVEDLGRRQTQSPPSVRALRPEVAEGLDAVVARLLAIDPVDRYATPRAAMRALLPFLPADASSPTPSDAAIEKLPPAAAPAVAAARARGPRILLVDDEAGIREVCRFALEPEGYECDEAADGLAALQAASSGSYDLLLLDVDLPGLSGPEVCRRLRAEPPGPHLKIIMVSGNASNDEMARMLQAGADDYLAKPFGLVPLQARIGAALRHKETQERTGQLNRSLLAVNHELEQAVTARDCDLVHARNALVLALAKLAESRDNETGEHLLRLQKTCRLLAEEAAGMPAFADQIDENFVASLECCVPLHDIGKVGLPDHILCKPGPLEPSERLIMQTHTIIGAETLGSVAEQHGFARGFLHLAIDIARHHHERYDGKGYPDRLAGGDIPLAARLVALCDVYDALRSRRAYKPSLPHADVLELMALDAAGQFDPGLWQAFLRCAHRFDQIFQDLTG